MQFQHAISSFPFLIDNGFPIVDNDGLHSRKTVSGDIPLKVGLYKFEVQYFERGGQESLDVKLYRLYEIPWDLIAFETVEIALKAQIEKEANDESPIYQTIQ